MGDRGSKSEIKVNKYVCKRATSRWFSSF